MRIAILPFLALLLGAGPPGEPGVEPLPAPAMIRDIFGRPLDRHGLVLVDWEGQIANPAIRIDLVSPPDAAYPVRFLIRAKEPRLYFDLPSRSGPSGPSKEVLLQSPRAVLDGRLDLPRPRRPGRGSHARNRGHVRRRQAAIARAAGARH